jgi:hypothetical protein
MVRIPPLHLVLAAMQSVLGRPGGIRSVSDESLRQALGLEAPSSHSGWQPGEAVEYSA